MNSPRHGKYASQSPRVTGAAQPAATVYALPSKRLDLFAPTPPGSHHHQQHGSPLDASRTNQRTAATPKSLSTMHFDAVGTNLGTLYATPSASSPARTTPAFPIKPQNPHPRTSVATTADFLGALRARSLLDYSFMREFSLERAKPVEERSLTKLSANSMYSMRMAQLALDDQGRTFTGRQQWLLQSEPLVASTVPATATTAATDESAKSDDDVRAPTSVGVSATSTTSAAAALELPHRNTATLKRSRAHKPAEADAALSRFPTLSNNRGTNAHNQLHQLPSTTTTTRTTTTPRNETSCTISRAQHSLLLTATPRSTTTAIDTSARCSPTSTTTTPSPSSTLFDHDVSTFDRRKCHASAAVAQHHGFLTEQDIPALMAQTGYSRTELFGLWTRFKALCSIAQSPIGIDRETFHRGIPQLSVEDDLFLDRVFAILDTDGSGILEWQEFVEAMSALERGDVVQRVRFLFRVYDLNSDGTIHRTEARQFFVASLLGGTTTCDLTTTTAAADKDSVDDVARHFVDKIFAAVGCSDSETMCVEHAVAFMQTHPAADIYRLFGRTMVSLQSRPEPQQQQHGGGKAALPKRD